MAQSCLCFFRHSGITNASLRELIAGVIPRYGPRQVTYDLRRLKRKASSAASLKAGATS
jgi:hypothetical protein